MFGPNNYRQRLGNWGEAVAKRYYRQTGGVVITSNFRCAAGEIDLIIWRSGQIIFVEVKTRTSHDFGYPEEAVTELKLQHLAAAAETWLSLTGYKGDIAWEIMAITKDRKGLQIRIIEDVTF